MEKDLRYGLAWRYAREHAAHLLLDPEEHFDAFTDSELTLAEQAEALRELRRIAGRLLAPCPEDA
ncbi:hypothetical protein D3C85_781900 [compost metagenome]